MQSVCQAGQWRRGGQGGQAMVEFALALPFFLFILLAALQLALIVMESYSVRQVTRDTTRWLAIHPDTVDSDVFAHAQAVTMPGMDSARFVTVTPTPACAALTAGHCTGRSSGTVVSVQITYDVAHIIFLPTDFGFGTLRFTVPTHLPPYQVSVMVE